MIKICGVIFLLALSFKNAIAATSDTFQDIIDPAEEFARVQHAMENKGVTTDFPIELLKENYMDRVNKELHPGLYATELFCWHHLHLARAFGRTIRFLVNDPTFEAPELLSVLDHWKERRHAFLEQFLTKRKDALSSESDKEACQVLIELNTQAHRENAEFYRASQGAPDNLEDFIDPLEDLPILKINRIQVRPITKKNIEDTLDKLQKALLSLSELGQQLFSYHRETLGLGIFDFMQWENPSYTPNTFVKSICDKWKLRRQQLIKAILQRLKKSQIAEDHNLLFINHVYGSLNHQEKDKC